MMKNRKDIENMYWLLLNYPECVSGPEKLILIGGIVMLFIIILAACRWLGGMAL